MSISSSRRTLGALLLATAAACGRQAQVASPAGGAPAPTQSISINSGEDVIRAMHAKYVGRWFKAITFHQTTSLLGASGSTNDQVWYVARGDSGQQRTRKALGEAHGDRTGPGRFDIRPSA